jgi:hypothetical protein
MMQSQAVDATDVQVRTIDNLQQYCYCAVNREAVDVSALAAFDSLDLILIDGDASLLPWMDCMRQVNSNNHHHALKFVNKKKSLSHLRGC